MYTTVCYYLVLQNGFIDGTVQPELECVHTDRVDLMMTAQNGTKYEGGPTKFAPAWELVAIMPMITLPWR